MSDRRTSGFLRSLTLPARLLSCRGLLTLARRLRNPEDLKATTLLRVTHAPEDWPRWFKAAGISGIQPKGPKFDYYGHALQAAADGVGVAMGIRPYIDDDLAAGRLVAPFAQSVPKGARWYLVYRTAREAEPAFVAFRDWIMNALRGKTRKTRVP